MPKVLITPKILLANYNSLENSFHIHMHLQYTLINNFSSLNSCGGLEIQDDED